MENITYLLGAGASRKCLPIVSEMSEKVHEVNTTFQKYFNENKVKNGTNVNQEEGNKLIQELNWLARVSNVERNFSVDTLAKKLLLSGNIDDYDKLKHILTLYFTLQQKFKSPDVRYDNFWASLLNEKE